MNQQQRKYLVSKIDESRKEKAKQLEASIPNEPNTQNGLLLALMEGRLRIRSEAEILQVLKERAKKGSSGNWLSRDTWRSGSQTEVTLSVSDLFIIPDDVLEELENYRKIKAETKREIAQLNAGAEALSSRIMLASDKTLDAMIAQIDDMGDIKLVDMTLRGLMSAGSVMEQKILTDGKN